MDEEMMVRIMRHMAWARAKGELDSMLNSYYGVNSHYDAMKRVIKEFISTVEDYGYWE